MDEAIHRHDAKEEASGSINADCTDNPLPLPGCKRTMLQGGHRGFLPWCASGRSTLMATGVWSSEVRLLELRDALEEQVHPKHEIEERMAVACKVAKIEAEGAAKEGIPPLSDQG